MNQETIRLRDAIHDADAIVVGAGITAVFNVFGEKDEAIYRALLF